MLKYLIIIVLCIVFLLSGCSLFQVGKTPVEVEQYENPMIWKEMFKVEVALWPLERKVNKIEKNVDEMRDELATTRLSSIQANKGIESLQAEIQQIKTESVAKEKPSVDLSLNTNIKKEMEKTKVVRKNKKSDSDIQAIIITDIQYYKVSATHDRILIYVNAKNDPKRHTLIGENPRILLDFLNSRNIDKEKYEINTDGNFIKRVRVRSYKEPVQKVRIVFDMRLNKKYSVERRFSEKENIYSFDIKAL